MTDPTQTIDAFTALAMLLLGLASIAAAFWGDRSSGRKGSPGRNDV
jgi:hypothetical protein